MREMSENMQLCGDAFMNRKGWFVGVTLFFCVLVTVGCQNPAFNRDRARCQHNLISLSEQFRDYRDRSDGHYPKLFSEVFSETNSGISDIHVMIDMFKCPSVKQAATTGGDAITAMGYYYVDWSKWYGTNDAPEDYPILYDRRLQNHHGQGINIVLLNGTVFWDAKAEWFLDFVKKHPDYGLILN